MKISAIDFSLAGDKYLGRSYEEMDCQAFVEKCMADVRYRRDLGGSNSWYRECMKQGWVGTPEECMKQFGSVPKGALLFILEPVGPKTPAKFRDDGVGDVTHMGIVTGRNDGAIHSSSSRGCVATSKFKGKTIPNGGWNRIGLLPVFDYGNTVNWVIEHSGFGQESKEEPIKEETSMNVIIQAENGGAVKLRQSSDPKRSGYSIWEEIPSGTRAEVLQSGENWSRIRVGNRSGWMMSRFLVADDGDVPAEPELSETDLSEPEPVEDEAQALLSEIYRVLRDLCEKIEQTIAMG